MLAPDVPNANGTVRRAFDEIRDPDHSPQNRAATADFFMRLRAKVPSVYCLVSSVQCLVYCRGASPGLVSYAALHQHYMRWHPHCYARPAPPRASRSSTRTQPVPDRTVLCGAQLS